MKIKTLAMLAVTGFFLPLIFGGCHGGSGFLSDATTDTSATGSPAATGDMTTGEGTVTPEGSATSGGAATSGGGASGSQKETVVSKDCGPKAAGTRAQCQSPCLARSPKDATITIDIPLRHVLKSMSSSEASMYFADQIHSAVDEWGKGVKQSVGTEPPWKVSDMDRICVFCKARQDTKTISAGTSGSNKIISMLDDIDSLCGEFGVAATGPEGWFNIEIFRNSVANTKSEGGSFYSISGYSNISQLLLVAIHGERFMLATPNYFDAVLSLQDTPDPQCPASSIITASVNPSEIKFLDDLFPAMFKTPPQMNKGVITVELGKDWILSAKWLTGANEVFLESITKVNSSYLKYGWLSAFKNASKTPSVEGSPTLEGFPGGIVDKLLDKSSFLDRIEKAAPAIPPFPEAIPIPEPPSSP